LTNTQKSKNKGKNCRAKSQTKEWEKILATLHQIRVYMQNINSSNNSKMRKQLTQLTMGKGL
jgi:hypothetical protein